MSGETASGPGDAGRAARPGAGDDTLADIDPLADLDAAEAERIRRGDHDLSAEQRALLRAGMGKVFKQIHDAQRKAADELESKPPRGRKGR